MNFLKTVFGFKRTRVWAIVSAVVLVLMITITILVETVFNDIILGVIGNRKMVSYGGGTYYTSDYEDKEDALEKSNAINERINEEGIILLKNDKNTLPFKGVKKISVFGKNSVNLTYGGAGSGAFTVTDETPTIYDSLAAAGFECNPTLKKFYEDSGKSGKGREGSPPLDNDRGVLHGFSTGETSVDKYDSVRSSYKDYNDAALVVVTRIGGESFDLPRAMAKGMDSNGNLTGPVDGAFDQKDHYLELDKNEQELLIKEVCANFSKVVLIVNCSTSFELGFLDDRNDFDDTVVDGMNDVYSKVGAALWIGGPGYSGIMALGRVLNGTVNPSGRTIDTYQRDFTKDPTYKNFSTNLTLGGNTYLVEGNPKLSRDEHFVDYEESIYMGYRYYETRGFTDGEEWYKDHVVFPFGYGLSYSEFEWKVEDWSFEDKTSLDWTAENDREFTIKINVRNKGPLPGKDVVQVYITAPYDKSTAPIEKPHVVLAGFVKTDLLDASEAEDYEVTFKAYDFASYDYDDKNKNDYAGYELEAGKYEVKVMKNAHDLVEKAEFTLSSGVKYEKDPVTGTKVENLYDDVSFDTENGMESKLSRSDWEGTFPVNEALDLGSTKERTITKEFYDKIMSKEHNNPNVGNVQMVEPPEVSSPVSTMQLYKLIQFNDDDTPVRDEDGQIVVDYDDPAWEEYINLLTAQEMLDFTLTGGFQTIALPSIGVMPAFASDGPVGFVYFMSAGGGSNPVYDTCAYASGAVIGATWNVELAYAMGLSVGNEGLIGNVRAGGRPYTGWYAPAVNLHRTPFSGRNFEYFSEDPLVSGKLGAEIVRACRSRGVYCMVKHFAVNDQETHRSGVCTWLTEQALREMYLKPFEIIVKEGGAQGIMSSFNRLGSLWTGGDYRLCTTILRDEWGFKGLIITDFNTEPFMDTRQMTYAGGDLNLQMLVTATWKPTTASDYAVLRNATKNILYTTVRSNNMNGSGEGGYYIIYYAWWEVLIFVLDIVFGVAIIGLGVAAMLTSWFASKKKALKDQE